jgi:hypothetical protein
VGNQATQSIYDEAFSQVTQDQMAFQFGVIPPGLNEKLVPAHVQRLAQERHELANKIQKLIGFMESGEIFKTLPKEEQSDLDQQGSFMRGYLQILDRRLARFTR